MLKRRRATLEAATDFEKTHRALISLNLVKILNDFNLTRSFNNVVNLDYTKRFAKASATTTTPSTMTPCCESAASVLLETLLRLFEA